MAPRILICGLGSIGRRHASVLRHLGVGSLHAYRTGRASLGDADDLVDETWDDLGAALEQEPDVVIVANPTSLHVETAQQAIDAGAHCLIEKPAGIDAASVRRLGDTAQHAGLVVSVAHNLRHHPLLIAVRDVVRSGELGAPLLLRAHFGAYLPAWHPWEDFSRSYAARTELGGGALLTHIHEPDLAFWLLGAIKASTRLSLGRSPLGTDVDEASCLQFLHASGALSSLTLSLAEQPPSRTLNLAFEGGTLQADLLAATLEVQEASQQSARHQAFDPVEALEASYRGQMSAFLHAVDTGAAPPVPLSEAADVLAAATGIDEEARTW